MYTVLKTSPETMSTTGEAILKSCLPWSGLSSLDFAELTQAIINNINKQKLGKSGLPPAAKVGKV